jgi:nucleoside-diphosphate-sugar epimerase
MRYFLTGATGFVGGRLLNQLLDEGHVVHALVRDRAKAGAIQEDAVRRQGRLELVEGDITDKESMRIGMDGADGVNHCAAWYKVGGAAARSAKEARAINVDGTRNVLELMDELSVPKGVYISTLAVNSDTRGEVVDESYRFDGEHLCLYNQTKWEAHYKVAEPMMKAGLPLVVVMPGIIYGPGDTSILRPTIQKYLKSKLFGLPKVPEYSWAHVDDVADACVLAMQKGRVGEDYIISGERYGFAAAFDLMAEISGVPAPTRRFSPSTLRFFAGFMAAFTWMNPPEDFHPEVLRLSAEATYLGDNSKAREELGYEPRSLRDGLEETLAVEMSALHMVKK